jgi:hypothetical protein
MTTYLSCTFNRHCSLATLAKNTIMTEDCMNTTIFNKTIQLNDGRILGYTDFGNPESTPIFHFHAWPGSRLETKLIHYLFKEHQESGTQGGRILIINY